MELRCAAMCAAMCAARVPFPRPRTHPGCSRSRAEQDKAAKGTAGTCMAQPFLPPGLAGQRGGDLAQHAGYLNGRRSPRSRHKSARLCFLLSSGLSLVLLVIFPPPLTLWQGCRILMRQKLVKSQAFPGSSLGTRVCSKAEPTGFLPKHAAQGSTAPQPSAWHPLPICQHLAPE